MCVFILYEDAHNKCSDFVRFTTIADNANEQMHNFMIAIVLIFCITLENESYSNEYGKP